VLGESGYSSEEVEALTETGAAKGPDTAQHEETFLA
jgi:hypothetical protein